MDRRTMLLGLGAAIGLPFLHLLEPFEESSKPAPKDVSRKRIGEPQASSSFGSISYFTEEPIRLEIPAGIPTLTSPSGTLTFKIGTVPFPPDLNTSFADYVSEHYATECGKLELTQMLEKAHITAVYSLHIARYIVYHPENFAPMHTIMARGTRSYVTI